MKITIEITENESSRVPYSALTQEIRDAIVRVIAEDEYGKKSGRASCVPQKSYADALTDAFAGNGTFRRAFTSADAEDAMDYAQDIAEDAVQEIMSRTEDIAEDIADRAEDIIREKMDTIAEEIADIARSIIAEDTQSSRIYRVPSAEEIADAEDAYAGYDEDAILYLRTTEDASRVLAMCDDILLCVRDADILPSVLYAVQGYVSQIRTDASYTPHTQSWDSVLTLTGRIPFVLSANHVNARLQERVQYVCDVCTSRLRM